MTEIMNEQSPDSKEILRLLAKAEEEIASGQGYDLDEVLEDVDQLLLIKNI